jgi:hypothetical protein
MKKKTLTKLQDEHKVCLAYSDDLDRFKIPYDECETKGLMILLNSARIKHGKIEREMRELFQEQAKLNDIMHRLKAELATREHVPNKLERRVIRQKKAKNKG